MRKTKHNALDENAVYGAPIWKSEGVNRSRLIDGCNEKMAVQPSFNCGLTPVSKNVFMRLTQDERYQLIRLRLEVRRTDI